MSTFVGREGKFSVRLLIAGSVGLASTSGATSLACSSDDSNEASHGGEDAAADGQPRSFDATIDGPGVVDASPFDSASIVDSGAIADSSDAALASFTGLYVISSPFSGPNYFPVDANIVEAPQVDGVFASLEWFKVQPNGDAGVYDWTELETVLGQAVSAHKKVEIGLTGGGVSPSWVYTNGAGVHRNQFVIDLPPKADNCHLVSVPTYWDPNYISAYISTINALANELHRNPEWYDAVRIVKLEGINENTEETYIPAQEPNATIPNPCTDGSVISNANTIWQDAGYRPSLIIAAWEQMATAIGTAFPDKLLAMDILETGGSFPRIDNNGNLVIRNVDASPTFVDVNAILIAQALQMFPGRIAIQWDALSTTPLSAVAGDVLDAGRLGAFIGWQANGGAGANGSSCTDDGAPCTNATYQQLLDNGIDSGGRYIEVQAVNVDQFPAAMEEAQGRFAQ